MAEERFDVEVSGSRSVTALRTRPDGVEPRATFFYAPGAGSNLDDPFGAVLARALADDGVEVVRFQFPYMEAGRSAPDRPPVLEATWRAVLDDLTVEGRPVIAGGRSMGGRIASQVSSLGAPIDALALFAYPLHPPGRPENARDAHLGAIEAPVLFVSGTRDAFGTPEELVAAAALVPRAQIHLLEGADHGFSVLKSSRRSRADVWQEASEALRRFLNQLPKADMPVDII
jgi:predicted alpha/beta-hydrolase family hydrolase